MKSGAPRPHPGIAAIRLYRGGKARLQGGPVDSVKLSSNETPWGPSPKALAAFRRASAALARYPDGSAEALRTALARHHDLDPARIVCGAGSDELLHLLACAYLSPGTRAIHPAKGFALYPSVIRTSGARPVAAPNRGWREGWRTDVSAILSKVSESVRAVFLSNPDNPTGTALDGQEIARLLEGLPPSVLLILDEAYGEYADGFDRYESGFRLARDRGNVVVVRTFSKIYGLAGLRAGWAYAPAPVADVLNRVRGPFNVSAPAQAAALAALADQPHVKRAAAHNRQWRAWLAEEMLALGIEAPPSAANFLLLRFPGRTPEKRAARAARAFGWLAEHGLIVREMGGYDRPDCLRVSIGLAEANRRLARALKDFMKHEHAKYEQTTP